MKCPKCQKEVHSKYEHWVDTWSGGYLGCDLQNLIDPAELLELVEKAVENPKNAHPLCGDIIVDAIKSYLSGDPEPLRRLVGEEG